MACLLAASEPAHRWATVCPVGSRRSRSLLAAATSSAPRCELSVVLYSAAVKLQAWSTERRGLSFRFQETLPVHVGLVCRWPLSGPDSMRG